MNDGLLYDFSLLNRFRLSARFLAFVALALSVDNDDGRTEMIRVRFSDGALPPSAPPDGVIAIQPVSSDISN